MQKYRNAPALEERRVGRPAVGAEGSLAVGRTRVQQPREVPHRVADRQLLPVEDPDQIAVGPHEDVLRADVGVQQARCEAPEFVVREERIEPLVEARRFVRLEQRQHTQAELVEPGRVFLSHVLRTEAPQPDVLRRHEVQVVEEASESLRPEPVRRLIEWQPVELPIGDRRHGRVRVDRLGHQGGELRGELGQRLDLRAEPLGCVVAPGQLHDPLVVDLVGIDGPPGPDLPRRARSELREHRIDPVTQVGGLGHVVAHTVGPVSGRGATGTSSGSLHGSRKPGTFSANHATTAALNARAHAEP